MYYLFWHLISQWPFGIVNVKFWNSVYNNWESDYDIIGYHRSWVIIIIIIIVIVVVIVIIIVIIITSMIIIITPLNLFSSSPSSLS